jgi:hypothetical protein
MKSVDFNFDLDEVVIVKLTGDKGIITFLGFDDAGVQYAVKNREGSIWWKESQIEKVPE